MLLCACYKKWCKMVFLVVLFVLFLVFFEKKLGVIFLYGLLHMLCGIYDVYVIVE